MSDSDTTRFDYGRRQPIAETARTLVILDTRPDGANRTRRLVESLEPDGIDVFFQCGPSPAIRAGNSGGDCALACAVKDLDDFIQHIAQTHCKRTEDVAVLATGLDALLLAVWAHDYAPRIRAMVLVEPQFQAGASGISRKSFRYTVGRLVADAPAIRVPTLLLDSRRSGGLLRPSPQNRFFERLQTPFKRLKALAHPDGDEGLAEVRQFIADAFERDTSRPTLLHADRYGYTQAECETLRTPLPWFSARGLRYRLTGAGIRSLALVSPGIRLAVRTGFDSGQMLDYVYENRARGWLPLRWIDRIFLDNIGWRACRRRKALTEKMLREAIGRVAAAGQPVRILDIAAGPGRYILDILRTLPGVEISALLCDNVAANLEDGRTLAEQLGLKNVTFQLGDAFDEQALARIEPSPNLAVACGIYQLIGDNDLLLRSLRGLAAALRGGGYLVYTSLPWDPGLELSARALVNRLGEAAIRRRRTQEELDELVRAGGFEKIAMEIDEFGMSTVSLAQKTVG